MLSKRGKPSGTRSIGQRGFEALREKFSSSGGKRNSSVTSRLPEFRENASEKIENQELSDRQSSTMPSKQEVSPSSIMTQST